MPLLPPAPPEPAWIKALARGQKLGHFFLETPPNGMVKPFVRGQNNFATFAPLAPIFQRLSAINAHLCKMSARADKIGGAWFSPRRAARLRCAIACNYERRDNLLHARECPVLPGFCKCRNILLHLRAPIAPNQDGKAAFSGAAVSSSLQIRLDSPRGSIQVPAYSINLCPVRSAGVPGGRRMGGGGRETRHSRACVRAFQVSGRFSNKSRQFSYLPGAPLQSRRLPGACKR